MKIHGQVSIDTPSGGEGGHACIAWVPSVGAGHACVTRGLGVGPTSRMCALVSNYVHYLRCECVTVHRANRVRARVVDYSNLCR